MSLDTEVQRFLATKPDAGSSEQPVAARRAAILAASDALFAEFGEPADGFCAVEDHTVPAPSGSVRVRVYRPDGDDGHAVHVFLHGGGFWLGSIDERVVDATCRERCIGAQCVVVAVDYRLAPEHQFPTPLEDCYQALRWAHANAPRFGGNPENISVGGVSAGANLAAAVALTARDRGGPALTMQLLEVPPLDLSLTTMRASAVGDAFGITVDEMKLCADLYVPSSEDVRNPLVSPLLAADLRGLPAAFVMTAEFDPLRLDGERYAARLESAGVAAEHRRYRGAVHGSILLTGNWPPARRWRADVINAIRRAAPCRVDTPA